MPCDHLGRVPNDSARSKSARDRRSPQTMGEIARFEHERNEKDTIWGLESHVRTSSQRTWPKIGGRGGGGVRLKHHFRRFHLRIWRAQAYLHPKLANSRSKCSLSRKTSNAFAPCSTRGANTSISPTP